MSQDFTPPSGAFDFSSDSQPNFTMIPQFDGPDSGATNMEDEAARLSGSSLSTTAHKVMRKSAAGRSLIRWDFEKDQYLLLCVEYVCLKAGLQINWDEAVALMKPGATGQAAIQHLAKLRKLRIDKGQAVPPEIVKRRTKRVAERLEKVDRKRKLCDDDDDDEEEDDDDYEQPFKGSTNRLVYEPISKKPSRRPASRPKVEKREDFDQTEGFKTSARALRVRLSKGIKQEHSPHDGNEPYAGFDANSEDEWKPEVTETVVAPPKKKRGRPFKNPANAVKAGRRDLVTNLRRRSDIDYKESDVEDDFEERGRVGNPDHFAGQNPPERRATDQDMVSSIMESLNNSYPGIVQSTEQIRPYSGTTTPGMMGTGMSQHASQGSNNPQSFGVNNPNMFNNTDGSMFQVHGHHNAYTPYGRLASNGMTGSFGQGFGGESGHVYGAFGSGTDSRLNRTNTNSSSGTASFNGTQTPGFSNESPVYTPYSSMSDFHSTQPSRQDMNQNMSQNMSQNQNYMYSQGPIHNHGHAYPNIPQNAFGGLNMPPARMQPAQVQPIQPTQMQPAQMQQTPVQQHRHFTLPSSPTNGFIITNPAHSASFPALPMFHSDASSGTMTQNSAPRLSEDGETLDDILKIENDEGMSTPEDWLNNDQDSVSDDWLDMDESIPFSHFYEQDVLATDDAYQ